MHLFFLLLQPLISCDIKKETSRQLKHEKEKALTGVQRRVCEKRRRETAIAIPAQKKKAEPGMTD
jgi:hypothetical protein